MAAHSCFRCSETIFWFAVAPIRW